MVDLTSLEGGESGHRWYFFPAQWLWWVKTVDLMVPALAQTTVRIGR